MPVSTYGASKLAGEALLCSYCHMFGIRGRAFRFGNVVGPNQTHGVGFDFVRKLLDDPTRLRDPRRRHPEQVLRPRRRRASTRCCSPARPAAEPFDGVQRRDRRLHHGHRDRRRSPSRCLGLDPGSGRARATRAATAAGRATCRSSASPPTGSASLGWQQPRTAPRRAPGLDDRHARRRPRRTTVVSAAGRRAVFLDRDGVLNRSRGPRRPPPPAGRSAGDVELPARSRGDACRRLADAGWLLVVVTNQPDIARGASTRARGRRDQRRRRRRAPGRPRSSSAPTTTPTAAPAASPSPGMLLDAADALGRRSCRERDGR